MGANRLQRHYRDGFLIVGALAGISLSSCALDPAFSDAHGAGFRLPPPPPTAPAAPVAPTAPAAPVVPLPIGDTRSPGDGDRSELDKYPADRYELHGVVSRPDCQKMEFRFQAWGRKIRLIKTTANPSKGILRWVCIFDGEDANPVENPFDDHRYNSKSEYEYP